jgi:hypothetical protein
MKVARVVLLVTAAALAISALGLLGLALFARDTILAAVIEEVLSFVGVQDIPAAAHGGLLGWIATAFVFLVGTAAALWFGSRFVGRAAAQ